MYRKLAITGMVGLALGLAGCGTTYQTDPSSHSDHRPNVGRFEALVSGMPAFVNYGTRSDYATLLDDTCAALFDRQGNYGTVARIVHDDTGLDSMSPEVDRVITIATETGCTAPAPALGFK